jgi:hypothetical protein
MTSVLLVLSASFLLGLAIGFVFRVWVHLIVAPLIAIGSATWVAYNGFRFFEGALITFACISVSQAAYLVGVVIASPAATIDCRGHDILHEQPGQSSQQNVNDEDRQRRCEQPSRPSPPQALNRP